MIADLSFRPVPEIVAGVIVLLGSYLYAISPWNAERPIPAERWRVVAFLAGTLVIFAALHPPIDTLGEAHFSMHMTQHVMLTFIGVPLCLVGLPPWLIAPILRSPRLRQIVKGVTRLPVAFLVGPGVYWFWHAPTMYQWALENRVTHDLQHITIVLGAVVMWWPALIRVSALGAAREPLQLLYLLLLMVPAGVLTSVLVLADEPFYAWYTTAPRLWDISPLDDQRLGGLIMKITGTVVIWGLASIYFFRWMAREEAPALPLQSRTAR